MVLFGVVAAVAVGDAETRESYLLNLKLEVR
jgi:hypothetical protein